MSEGKINAGCVISVALTHAKSSVLEKKKKKDTQTGMCVMMWDWLRVGGDLHRFYMKLNETDETYDIPVVMQDHRRHYDTLYIICF